MKRTLFTLQLLWAVVFIGSVPYFFAMGEPFVLFKPLYLVGLIALGVLTRLTLGQNKVLMRLLPLVSALAFAWGPAQAAVMNGLSWGMASILSMAAIAALTSMGSWIPLLWFRYRDRFCRSAD